MMAVEQLTRLNRMESWQESGFNCILIFRVEPVPVLVSAYVTRHAAASCSALFFDTTLGRGLQGLSLRHKLQISGPSLR